MCERRPSLEDEEGEKEQKRRWETWGPQTATTAELQWTLVVCSHPNLSAHPLYLVLCLFVQPKFQVSECAWHCQIENEQERWKEKMDRERKRPACMILTNTQQSGLIPLPQTTNHWFWQGLLSPLILRGLNQACLCRRAIPNCTSIWTVNIARSRLCLCAVQILFFTALLRRRINWKTIPALAGSVYTFQIIALTHRTEHQKEATMICIFFLLIVNFKVHCRSALREIQPIHLLLWPSTKGNTLNTVGHVFVFLKRIAILYRIFLQI